MNCKNIRLDEGAGRNAQLYHKIPSSGFGGGDCYFIRAGLYDKDSNGNDISENRVVATFEWVGRGMAMLSDNGGGAFKLDGGDGKSMKILLDVFSLQAMQDYTFQVIAY